MTKRKRATKAGDRARALSALAGQCVPKVGDLGHHQRADRIFGRKVRVVRVSDTGKTIWLRFDDTGKGLSGRAVAWRRVWPHVSDPIWWRPWPDAPGGPGGPGARVRLYA